MHGSNTYAAVSYVLVLYMGLSRMELKCLIVGLQVAFSYFGTWCAYDGYVFCITQCDYVFTCVCAVVCMVLSTAILCVGHDLVHGHYSKMINTQMRDTLAVLVLVVASFIFWCCVAFVLFVMWHSYSNRTMFLLVSVWWVVTWLVFLIPEMSYVPWGRWCIVVGLHFYAYQRVYDKCFRYLFRNPKWRAGWYARLYVYGPRRFRGDVPGMYCALWLFGIVFGYYVWYACYCVYLCLCTDVAAWLPVLHPYFDLSCGCGYDTLTYGHVFDGYTQVSGPVVDVKPGTADFSVLAVKHPVDVTPDLPRPTASVTPSKPVYEPWTPRPIRVVQMPGCKASVYTYM